jgi:hypothetical protein
MNVKIDCSVLNDVITECYQHCRGDDRAVEHITTSLVENGVVDDTWGYLMYGEDGDWLPDGMEVDQQIQDQLEQYITTTIKTL